MTRRSREHPALVALAAIVAFVALATRAIRLPGLYYDELFELVPSLSFVRGGLSSVVGEVPQTEISILGHPLALMTQPYNGGLKTILFSPLAALFGISPASVRLFNIGMVAAALILYYLFARRLFSSVAVAAAGVALLALDASFLFYSRVDYAPSSVMFLCKALALWQLAVWWRTARTPALLIGAFALGLGVYDKVTFAWFVAAALAAAALVHPRGLRQRLNIRKLAGAAAAFVLGALPLVIYNLSAWPPPSLGPLRAGTINLAAGNYEGNLVEQLEQRLRILQSLLQGGPVTSNFAGNEYLQVPVMPMYVVLSAALIVALFIRRSSRSAVRPGMFVLLCGIGVVLAAALTPEAHTPHHLLLAYPFAHFTVAAATVYAYQLARRHLSTQGAKTVAVALLAALALPVTIGVVQTVHIERRLGATGGLGNFSDGIYELDDYLVANDRKRRIVVLDWGIYYNLVGLSDGRLRCRELWFQLEQPGRPDDRLIAELTDRRARYILHARAATNFELPRQDFFTVTRRAKLQPRLEKRIETRDGRPLFEVYSLAAA